MNGFDFWRTVRGAMLADPTLPQLVIELRRLNDNLERLQGAGLDMAAMCKKEKP